MGNANTSEKYYNSHYTTLDENQINHIRENYKVIDINWLDKIEVNSKMFNDDFFIKSPIKKQVVNNMLDFYLNDKYKNVYKRTEYLCNKKEKICICNTHAEYFRKVYSRKNYTQNDKYISWCEKIDDDF